MYSLFISDLHLQSQRPHITRAFFHLLDTLGKDADAIYILGDFFDVWIGDDENTPLQIEVANTLAQLVERGLPLWLMPGNRDFLIGESYCRRAGLRWLPDPSLIDLYGTPVLLMHGDSLCTDDRGYQRYRRFIRSGFIRWLQNYVSLATRQRIGRLIRGRSAAENQYKSRQLLDINPEAAHQALRHHGAQVLIHGHTHRPASHPLSIDGVPGERIVLGDWDQQGWYLQWFRDGSHHLHHFAIDNAP